MKPHPLDPFPRNSPAIVRSLLGKKVIASTTDFHYLVGHLVGVGDGAGGDDHLVFDVKGQSVRLPRSGLATIREADAATAEYVK